MRPPAVAGQFYAGTRSSLIEQIERCYTHSYGPGKVLEVQDGPRRLVGLVSPHAGYVYSGPVAAHGFMALANDGTPEVMIIIGPVHRPEFSGGVYVDFKETWSTPLGQTETDRDFVSAILKEAKFVVKDSLPHLEEHSIEVQLPFLQHLFGFGFKIVPIAMGAMDIKASTKLGTAISVAAKKLSRDIVVIASSDFIHYGVAYGYMPVTGSLQEILKWIKNVDLETIHKIEKLDLTGFYDVLRKYHSTTCGYGPIAACMSASKAHGVKNGKLLSYATSYETAGGSPNQIVGYASIAF